ncbi:MAG: lamin tail domain-containing protein, partial [Planctomycetota bacterium]
SGGVKISQIYGGGGSTSGGPTYNKDYVEIFNSSSSPVNIGGWAIEYGSATGTWGSSTSAIFTFPAGTTIQPCQYLLVASATASSAGGALTVTPDFTFNTAMSATNGKVGLFNAVNSAKACGSETAGTLVDKISYGTGNCPEGTATAALTVITGAVRNGDGATDTDNNSADFTLVTAPVPHNSASPAPASCSGGTPCPEDVDGDGQVSSGDIAVMLLDFGPCQGCSSDLDGDGQVSSGDVALLLLSYGPCP